MAKMAVDASNAGTDNSKMMAEKPSPALSSAQLISEPRMALQRPMPKTQLTPVTQLLVA
jgi:hypothetical protein